MCPARLGDAVRVAGVDVSNGCFRVYRDEVNSRDIHFEVASVDISQIPEEQLRLRDEVDRTLTVLRAAFSESKDECRFEEYYRSLLSIAQTGLVGESAQPKLAESALATFRNDIVAREAGIIKNRYMKTLGKRAFLIGIGPLLVSLFLSQVVSQMEPFSNFLLLWTGCMAGVWLSFGARKKIIRFEDLQVLEEDRLEPTIRLIFAGLLTIIFGLLFSTKAVSVHVGAINSNDFTSNSQIALLMGLILGFSETALPSALSSHAANFLKN